MCSDRRIVPKLVEMSATSCVVTMNVSRWLPLVSCWCLYNTRCVDVVVGRTLYVVVVVRTNYQSLRLVVNVSV